MNVFTRAVPAWNSNRLWSRLRPTVVATNALVFVCFCCALIGSQVSEALLLASAGTIAIVSVIFGGGMDVVSFFQVFKNKVIMQIRSSEQKKAFVTKFFALSCFLGFFTLESLLWLGAIVTGQGFFESSTTVHAIFFFVDICSLVSLIIYLQAWASPQDKNQNSHFNNNNNLAPRKSATTSKKGNSGNQTPLPSKAAAYYVPPTEEWEPETEPEIEDIESEIHISQLRPLNQDKVPTMETLVSINAFDELSIHDLHDFDDIEALSIMDAGTQNIPSVSQYPHDFTSLTNMAVFFRNR